MIRAFTCEECGEAFRYSFDGNEYIPLVCNDCSKTLPKADPEVDPNHCQCEWCVESFPETRARGIAGKEERGPLYLQGDEWDTVYHALRYWIEEFETTEEKALLRRIGDAAKEAGYDINTGPLSREDYER